LRRAPGPTEDVPTRRFSTESSDSNGELPRARVRELEPEPAEVRGQRIQTLPRGGLHAHGFARAVCETCGDELLLPFSCKLRWLRPRATLGACLAAALFVSSNASQARGHTFQRRNAVVGHLSVKARRAVSHRAPAAARQLRRLSLADRCIEQLTRHLHDSLVPAAPQSTWCRLICAAHLRRHTEREVCREGSIHSRSPRPTA